MLIYIGKGAAIPDVPARNLTDDEVQSCGGEVRLIKSGLYKRPPKKKQGEKEDERFSLDANQI